MKLHEVPVGWIAASCPVCHDVLAIPPGTTREDRRQVAEDHRWLCPGRLRACTAEGCDRPAFGQVCEVHRPPPAR